MRPTLNTIKIVFFSPNTTDTNSPYATSFVFFSIPLIQYTEQFITVVAFLSPC